MCLIHLTDLTNTGNITKVKKIYIININIGKKLIIIVTFYIDINIQIILLFTGFKGFFCQGDFLDVHVGHKYHQHTHTYTHTGMCL